MCSSLISPVQRQARTLVFSWAMTRKPAACMPFVAVHVVDVPSGVDHRMRRIAADGGDGLANVGNCGREAGINQYVSVFARLHGHVAASALQQPDVVVEPGRLNGCGCSAGSAHLRQSGPLAASRLSSLRKCPSWRQRVAAPADIPRWRKFLRLIVPIAVTPKLFSKSFK